MEPGMNELNLASARYVVERLNYLEIYSLFGYDNDGKPELLFQTIYLCRNQTLELYEYGKIAAKTREFEQLADVCEIGDMLL